MFLSGHGSVLIVFLSWTRDVFVSVDMCCGDVIVQCYGDVIVKNQQGSEVKATTQKYVEDVK